MFSKLFSCFNDTKVPVLVPEPEPVVKQITVPNPETPIVWSDTLQFIPPVNTGQVIKVYDGDTITIAGHLPYDGSPLYRFSVRLNGIDCAEIKGKTEEEKVCALRAKDQLNQLIMNKIVVLKNVKNEKYGRLLADVYVGDLHVNQYMLDKGLAVKYDGGTKHTVNWLEIHV
jgi:endonuclease YncB( thermonuclease family)